MISNRQKIGNYPIIYNYSNYYNHKIKIQNYMLKFFIWLSRKTFVEIVVPFLALVTKMVTKVDHGNHCSNDHGNHHSNHPAYYNGYYDGNKWFLHLS